MNALDKPSAGRQCHKCKTWVEWWQAHNCEPEPARPGEGYVTGSEWMGEDGAALRNNLDEITRRIARTVAALREWRTLEYKGMFIDLPDEQKAAVAEVAARTETVLREWGYEIEPRSSSIAGDERRGDENLNQTTNSIPTETNPNTRSLHALLGALAKTVERKAAEGEATVEDIEEADWINGRVSGLEEAAEIIRAEMESAPTVGFSDAREKDL